MRLERGSKEPLFHVSRAPSDLSFRPKQDDSRSESSCGNGTCFSVQEGLFKPSPRSVILSEVVVREADDNVVEGPRVSSGEQRRLRAFSRRSLHGENALIRP
jgi:hypothetical protein